MSNFHDMTAESMPTVRKAAKALGVVAFFILFLSAVAMTFSVMMERGKGEEWFVVVGLVSLGLAADFWVAAGPIMLRSARSWGEKLWARIGWASLIMALAFSFTNKLGYWVERSNHREVAYIERQIDPLQDERKLVADNPDARVPEAVRAEETGARAALRAKQLEYQGLPENWPTRRREALREMAAIEMRIAQLESERVTAEKVAEAKEKIANARTSEAQRLADDKGKVDPLAQWIVAIAALWGAKLTPDHALIWLHAMYAFFHEAAQMMFLGLATLRIPQKKADEEQEYVIAKRRRKVTKKVSVAMLKAQERLEIAEAEARLTAKTKAAKKIAEARATLENDRAMREVARERREFEMQCKYEDGVWDGLKPLGDDRALPDYSSAEPIAVEPIDSKPEVYAKFVDAVRSAAAKRGWDTRRAKAKVERTDEDGTEYEKSAETRSDDPRKPATARGAHPWEYATVANIGKLLLKDPRVVRPLEAQDAAVSDQPADDAQQSVPDVPSAGASGNDHEDDRTGRDGPANGDQVHSPDTTDLIAPPLSQEQAQALVDSGTHEYVTDDNGDRWLREIEREAQQGAADEIVLADGQGVMKTERADG